MGQYSNRIRVLIAEDQAFVREAFVFALSQYADLEVIGGVATGEEALSRLHDLNGAVDVVLMDVRMPGMGGIAATREIHKLWPGCAILLLTSYPHYSEAGVQAGARGYVLKKATTEELRTAIRVVHNGGLFSHQWNPEAQTLMSEQELKALKALADGASNSELATMLHLAPGSVKRLLTSIFTKLNAQSRAQAVGIAIRKGLIP